MSAILSKPRMPVRGPLAAVPAPEHLEARLAAAALAGSVLLGYVVDRTIGMPNATGDIGNWTEPLGLTSIVVEGLTVAVALAGAALHRSPRAVVV